MSESETQQADPRRLYADDGTLLFIGEELADMTPEQRETMRAGLQQNAQMLGLLKPRSEPPASQDVLP